VIVPLRSKRQERAILAQKLQHGAPAIVLLGAGVNALLQSPQGFALALAAFEIASSVLLIVSMAHAVRKASRRANAAETLHQHRGVDWIDVFTAAVLFAEAAERYHVSRHIARPVILLAIVLLTIGLLHGKVATRAGKRRTLRVEDEGLYIGGKPFRSMRAAWSDVSSIEIGERYAIVTLKDGRRRKLDLSDLEGSNEVRAALAAAQRRVIPAAGC
jgi:hypothetical protein